MTADPIPPVPAEVPDGEQDRIDIAAAFVRSGFYDDDEMDLLQWHPCSDCYRPDGPRRGKCGCSGVPYISDGVWAKLGPAIAKIRAEGVAAGRKQAADAIRADERERLAEACFRFAEEVSGQLSLDGYNIFRNLVPFALRGQVEMFRPEHREAVRRIAEGTEIHD